MDEKINEKSGLKLSLCWYCYWGWPKPVAEIYQEALRDLDGYDSPLKSGPGHIVWSDENFDSAEWCLEHFDEYKRGYSDEEMAIVKKSLQKLASLPKSIRCVEPEDYDDEHPELFPPPNGTEMVRYGESASVADLKLYKLVKEKP